MEKVLRETFLRANSKKNAYYRLKIEQITDGYLIKKESGVGENRALHKETYFRKSLEEARLLHSKKIREKTNTRTKRDRVYSIVFDSDNSNRSMVPEKRAV